MTFDHIDPLSRGTASSPAIWTRSNLQIRVLLYESGQGRLLRLLNKTMVLKICIYKHRYNQSPFGDRRGFFNQVLQPSNNA